MSKRLVLSSMLGVLVLITAATSRGQENTDINVELQIVSLPESLAVPLVEELRDDNRIEAAFGRIQKLLVEKKAVLIGWPMVTTQDGKKASVEQIDELRYATDYAPPAVNVLAATSDAKIPKDKIQLDDQKVASFSVGMPIGFETRNTGVTLEVNPKVIDDGQSIMLGIVPQHVSLKAWEKVTIEKNPPGTKISVDQPRFVINKATTNLTVRNGERKLVGFFKVSEPAGNVELFILRAEIVRRENKKVERDARPPTTRPNNPFRGGAPGG